VFSRLRADSTTLLCCSGCGGTQCSGCWAEQLPVIIHVAILARFRFFFRVKTQTYYFRGRRRTLGETCNRGCARSPRSGGAGLTVLM